jgi:hypothetical protein
LHDRRRHAVPTRRHGGSGLRWLSQFFRCHGSARPASSNTHTKEPGETEGSRRSIVKGHAFLENRVDIKGQVPGRPPE